MGDNYNKINTTGFTDYLQSAVKLDALAKITQDLDMELEDSSRIMSEIKAMYESIPTLQSRADPQTSLRHEDISTFLETDTPKLLLPDMVENTLDVDVDNVIATMKKYAEELKKNFVVTEVQEKPKALVDLELEQYAVTLDQLGKRLANIKIGNHGEGNQKNPDLETKLSTLCEDVNMFTNMVQAKTTLSECNKTWTQTQSNSNALQYDSIINKLLAGINEVTYLLQNKN